MWPHPDMKDQIIVSTSRTRAEDRLAAISKIQKETLNERETRAAAISKNTARLKALRLAKEAEDLAEKPAKKPSPRKRTAKTVAS